MTKRNSRIIAIASMLIIVVALSFACDKAGDGTPRSTSAPAPTAVPSTAAPTPGRGGGGLPFATPSELAHHFKVGVFAPEGVALHGGLTAETDATGNLTNYGIGLFNGFGSLYVAGPAPASAAEYRTAADNDPQRTTVTRQIVKVHGADAVLYDETYSAPSSHRFRLLWAQGGRVLQIVAPGQVGADAVIAVANATKFFSLAEIDSANIIVDLRPNPAGDAVLYATPAEAAAALGVPVFAPPTYKRVLVRPDQVTGKPKTWEVDIDNDVFIQPSAKTAVPTDAAILAQPRPPGASAVNTTRVQVNGVDALFVTPGDAPPTLYFSVGGVVLELVDRSAKHDVKQMVSFAGGVRAFAPPAGGGPLAPTACPGTDSSAAICVTSAAAAVGGNVTVSVQLYQVPAPGQTGYAFDMEYPAGLALVSAGTTAACIDGEGGVPPSAGLGAGPHDYTAGCSNIPSPGTAHADCAGATGCTLATAIFTCSAAGVYTLDVTRHRSAAYADNTGTLTAIAGANVHNGTVTCT